MTANDPVPGMIVRYRVGLIEVLDGHGAVVMLPLMGVAFSGFLYTMLSADGMTVLTWIIAALPLAVAVLSALFVKRTRVLFEERAAQIVIDRKSLVGRREVSAIDVRDVAEAFVETEHRRKGGAFHFLTLRLHDRTLVRLSEIGTSGAKSKRRASEAINAWLARSPHFIAPRRTRA